MPEATAPPRLSRLVLLLGSIIAVGPLSIDLYLPAFPELVDSLGATETRIQLTLTACLVGLALGQFLSGPISDAVGRRRPLLVGMAGYAVASTLCALAPNAEVLTATRFLQGMTGAAGLVIAQALVRDQVSGVAVARVMSLLMLVIGVAPILAPVLGGQLLLLTGWRGLFWVLTAFGVIMTVVVAVFVRETLPVERRQTGGIRNAARSYRGLTRDRRFMAYLVASGLGFAVIFGYVSGSPFVYQEIHGVSPQAFGMLFGLNSLGLVAGSQLNARLVLSYSPLQILRVAVLISSVGSLALLATTSTGAFGLAGLVAPLFVVVSSLGLVLPNAGALAMDLHPESAGTAAALLGTSQSVVGAVAGPLVGAAGAGSAVPMAVVMTAGAVGAALVTTLVGRRARLAMRPAAETVT